MDDLNKTLTKIQIDIAAIRTDLNYASSVTVTYDGGDSASDVLGTTYTGGPLGTYIQIEELVSHQIDETSDYD